MAVTRSPKRRARDVLFMLKRFYPGRKTPEAATECLTDLMHLADRDGMDFDALSESAYSEFMNQREEKPQTGEDLE